MPAFRLLAEDLCFPECPRWHAGKLYVSDMHAGTVWTFAADGARERVVDVAARPAGLGFLPDGRMLAVSMLDRKLLRFDARGREPVVHADLSTLASFHVNDMVVERRVWADLGPQVFPDGICLDAQSCVWVANALGGFLRVAEGGEVRDRIDLDDGYHAFACMLGGPERRTLFLCEARGLRRAPLPAGSGRLRAVDVDVPGAGWP